MVERNGYKILIPEAVVFSGTPVIVKFRLLNSWLAVRNEEFG